jgi:hypothetical protein
MHNTFIPLWFVQWEGNLCAFLSLYTWTVNI